MLITRTARVVAVVLIGAGIGLAGFQFYSIRASDAVTEKAQADLRAQLDSSTTSTSTSLPPFEFGYQEDISFEFEVEPEPVAEAPPPGTPLGVLRFPTLDKEWVVVEGVGVEELKLGPGHMPWTPLPGSVGNAVISGHRTTYGGPFHDLHLLEVGDGIWFEGVLYGVTDIFIVSPTEVWVTEERGEEGQKLLTLTTCHPIGSARERLIVWAEVPVIGQ